MNKKELKKAFNEGLINKEKYLEELFRIEQTPVKKAASRIYDPVKMDEFYKLLKATKKEIHRLAFILAMGSGLRISELVGGVREDGTLIQALSPNNVNLKTKLIMIRSAKGKKDRLTNVPKWFKEKHLKFLPLQIGERALEKAFTRNSLKAGINEVIDTYERVLKDGTVQKVPIFRLKFHSLRRGYATEMFNRNIPANIVQAHMGHDNLATTTKYTKSNVEDSIGRVMDAWDQ